MLYYLYNILLGHTTRNKKIGRQQFVIFFCPVFSQTGNHFIQLFWIETDGVELLRVNNTYIGWIEIIFLLVAVTNAHRFPIQQE
jgi:hypothetical protein